MPVQKTTSKLMAKYGNRLDQAVKEVKDNETDYGFIRLPGGIKNGVAQLTKAYFDQYKEGDLKGEYFFRAEGTVVSPESVALADGSMMRIVGLQTSIMHPVCDTKRMKDGKQVVVPMKEHVDDILNEYRKLGLDTQGASGADLEPMAQALVEAAPYFKFNTRESKEVKNPDGSTKYEARVWESWNGIKGLEDFDPANATNGDGAGGVVDHTANGHVEPPQAEVNDNPEGIPNEAGGEQSDIDALVQQATDGDEEAAKQLGALALAAGATQADVDNAKDWAEVGELAKAAGSGGDEGAAAEAWAPEKGSVYPYTVLDPKTKKPLIDPKTKKARKPIDCECVAIEPKGETVTLKNLVDGKTLYKGVPWASIKPAE